ncbi:unnamed protein product, partial [Hymenolepis diminuta]
VTVRVAASKDFKREGADVHSDITISIAQAALGGKIRIPGIYDTVLVTIPPGSASHDKIRLPGKGISRVSGCGYGDHYVHLHIGTPKRLSELQRALLLAFAETETNVKGTTEGVAHTESGARRAIDNTEDFLLSRIRTAIAEKPTPKPDKQSQSSSSDKKTSPIDEKERDKSS